MFLRSRNEKSQTIEQTARADPQRRRGDIRKTHILYERSSSGGGFQPIRNCRKRVLFNGHDVVYKPALASLLSVQSLLRQRKGAPNLFRLDRETLRKLGCRTLNKIIEERGHLACFFIPFFPWAEGFIMVLGKQDMHLTFSNEATEVLAGLTAMGIVVSRNDACRNFDRLELRLGRPDDRQVGTLEKILPPVR